jgi:UDP-N-acetyl-D-mannosaminuronic acid dehydrogenase
VSNLNGSKYQVAVIGGAGHVGIPLVLCLAASELRVLIQDLNRAAMDTILSGQLPYVEYDAQPLLEEALAKGRIGCTENPSDIGQCDAVIVTIGTPVDEFLNPVNKVIKDCIDGLLPHLRDGQLVVLRSTVFPGTTDWLSYYFEQQGRKLKVAYCPERVVQGFGVNELRGLPQIISGTTPAAVDAAEELFLRIAPEVVHVSPLEAEFAKLFSNAHRYIEFATTNQFYMIAESAGADYGHIMRAMKHNYPRGASFPGPGFAAGPCLFKDTMQLAAFSGNHFGIGHAAMLINEGLVTHVVEKLRKNYDLRSTTVGLLGMAFKPDIDDVRASLSYKLKKSLLMYAKEVLTADPFVKTDPHLLAAEEVVERSEVLVLCTPHKTYKKLDLKGKPVVDLWSFFNG